MTKQKEHDFIKRIELELLSALMDYVLPFANRKIKPRKKEQSNLENIVNSKPKISLEEFKELENILLNNSNNKTKISRAVGLNPNNLSYSLNLTRQKNKNEKTGNYSINVKYEENESFEKIEIFAKNSKEEIYSAVIETKKERRDKVIPYKITINYESDSKEERLDISYNQVKNYLQKHIEEKEDTTSMVPLKWLNIFPESQMGGVLGFTYLGDTSMGRRADLSGKMARVVDIHESIHTPDEYETRVLTDWILEKPRPKYIK